MFVKDNDLYVKPGAESPAKRITDDGKSNLFNGVADATYKGCSLIPSYSSFAILNTIIMRL